jgi:threonine dehydrogenase-like Zn-dependent dehydrogenase
VAIVGIGFLGAILIQLCRAAGARVVVFTRRPFARELAESLGAESHSLNGIPGNVAAARDFAGGNLCDVVIEATGQAEPLNLAGELTRERGRLVIAGYHQDGPREINLQLWNWRGLDVINAHEREPAIYLEGMRTALECVLDGRIKVEPLITHRLPLEQLGKALDLTRNRPAGFLKALVLP